MKKTLDNVLQAYVGESQARNRYYLYAKTAKKEGYEQIAALFLEISEQEKTHGKNFFRMYKRLQNELNISEDEVTLESVHVPTVYGTTIDNLKAAIAGEHMENSKLYPEFAKIAEEEGYPKIAAQIRAISTAEEHHEEIYTKLLKELEAGTVFKKDEKIWWVCRECGYIHFGKEPPKTCPSCNHPSSYFQRKSENF
ncbi:MAG: rubrerythrin [Promethearchaeota archaeon]